jgi:hypothetical protein
MGMGITMVTSSTIYATALPENAPVHVSLKPAKRLGPQRFAEYQTATRGAVYDPVSYANLVPRHAWLTVYNQLRDGGFDVQSGDTAFAWLEEAYEQECAAEKAAESRIETLREKLLTEGKILRQYQVHGTSWLSSQRAAFLLDEQGLGKTIVAICAMPAGVPIIVDCPASLRLLWRDEIKKWRSDLFPIVVSGSGLLQAWPEPGEVFIVSDGWIRDTIQTQPWQYPMPEKLWLVSDECHRYKGRSARAECMQFFCQDIRRAEGSTIGLTGTPLSNTPQEMYTLFLVFGAARKAFGGWGEYTRMWNCTKGGWQGKQLVWGEASPIVRERVALVSLRRTRAEVLPELPTKTYQVIPCEVGKKLTKRMDEIYGVVKDDLDEWEASDEVIPPMSIAQHSALRLELARAKMEDMLEWIGRNSDTSEDDSPLVMFSMHRGPVDECAKLKGWEVIHGDVTVKARHAIVKAFEAGELRGVAVTIQSGGVGLTLVQSHRALFVDRAYAPPDNWQAEDRICRLGQKWPVFISRLVMDHPLERRQDEIVEKKSAMIRAAL